MDNNIRAAQYIAGAIIVAAIIIGVGVGDLGKKIASTLIAINAENRVMAKQAGQTN